MTTAALLETKGLTAGYGNTTILRDVSLTVPLGQIIAVVGPNGAGKTTLARAIAGVATVFEGETLLNGEIVTKWPIERRARAGMASVPEGRRLFPALSVADNLDLALFAKRRQLSTKERSQLLQSVLEMFPVLQTRAKQKAGSLSGGEQQMLAIGRALMLQPKLLILDEPSTGLAPIVIDRIFERIQYVAKTMGCGCLLIEQRAMTALAVSSYVFALDRGRITFAGAPIEIQNDAKLRNLYLGGVATKEIPLV